MGSGWELEDTDATTVDSDDDDLDAPPIARRRSMFFKLFFALTTS